MADQHITDEEIHSASGPGKPRMPAGVPVATCLRCGQEHHAFYATQACDCRIELAEKAPYGEWLVRFQYWGYGVLKTPSDRKFPDVSKVVSGRQALTLHLQSDLYIERHHVLEPYYVGQEWVEVGFDAVDPELVPA